MFVLLEPDLFSWSQKAPGPGSLLLPTWRTSLRSWLEAQGTKTPALQES